MSYENKPIIFTNFIRGRRGKLWFLLSLTILYLGIFASNRIPGSLVKVGFPIWLAEYIYLAAIPLGAISVRIRRARRGIYDERFDIRYFYENIYINIGGVAIPLAISAYIGAWLLLYNPMAAIYYLVGAAVSFLINRQLLMVDIEGIKIASLLLSFAFSTAATLFIVGVTGGSPIFYPYEDRGYNYLDILVAGSLTLGMFLCEISRVGEFFRIRREAIGLREDSIIIGFLGIGDAIFVPQIVIFLISPAKPL